MDAALKAGTNLAGGRFRPTPAVAELHDGLHAALPDKPKPRTTHGMESAMRTAEDMLSIGQANLDAVNQSVQSIATGVQDLMRQTMAAMQSRADETSALLRAVTSAKSVREAIELQTNLGQASVEKTVSELGKLTQASLNVFQQAIAPITQQIARVSDRVTTAA